MRIIVTGDRKWYVPELAEAILARLILRYGGSLVIVHGAATGVDQSFSEACADSGIEQERHPARWEDVYVEGAVVRHDRKRPYNANAGPMRNAEMVALGADMCIALHRRIRLSKGTRDCALRAIEARVPTYLIESELGEPRRLSFSDLV
ncbi:SLOG family protein [Paludisphaera borealis]|uniref:YspA cpYpsA-related SLOG domain-containing protein n=1 Tax=Paludisphaera borealis TaxID=1387353 RepID=A0A1U7CXD7_9BACT|nr:SLOG family protein [Paludisphaera borealis]APW63549.1 hypothetical protein BSF38_05121 [Paludisphaera borealis]